MSANSLYRIGFYNKDEEYYEIYAKNVADADNLMGFVCISGIVFGETSNVVVDPAEERLAREFADVDCFYVSNYSIVRIDQVKKRGQAKIQPLKRPSSPHNVSRLPLSDK